jgi:hypothetical protein
MWHARGDAVDKRRAALVEAYASTALRCSQKQPAAASAQAASVCVVGAATARHRTIGNDLPAPHVVGGGVRFALTCNVNLSNEAAGPFPFFGPFPTALLATRTTGNTAACSAAGAVKERRAAHPSRAWRAAHTERIAPTGVRRRAHTQERHRRSSGLLDPRKVRIARAICGWREQAAA